MTISRQLKQAIRDSGLSQYRISHDTGIADPILSRFLSDDPKAHRDVRLETTVDRLADYLGLELAVTGKGVLPKKRVAVKPAKAAKKTGKRRAKR